MGKLYIVNAFSLNMLPAYVSTFEKDEVIWGIQAHRSVRPPSVGLKNFKAKGVEVVWAIGHPDTSRIAAQMLGIPDPGPSRVNVQLEKGDWLYVAQYSGPRLPEGAVELPLGAKIEWWYITLSRTD